MNIPYRIRLENGRISEQNDCCVIESLAPSITWAVAGMADDNYQKAYRIRVANTQKELWDTGWVESREQSCRYQGKAFEAGEICTLSLEVQDVYGNPSECTSIRFCYGRLDPWPGQWIGEERPKPNGVVYFEKRFRVEGKVRSACLFSSGLGYQKIVVNGQAVEDRYMDPAFSEYEKRAYYAVFPELADYFQEGENCLAIQAATGWRAPENVCYKLTGMIPAYVGETQLSAVLRLEYEGGHVRWIYTDPSWRYQYGPIRRSNIFDGEIYDASYTLRDWGCVAGKPAEKPVRILPAPGQKLMPQTLEPVKNQEIYSAISVSMIQPGVWSVDFGQNIAGVCRLRLPSHLSAGQKITISHMEFLNEDGTLFLDPLRNAACVDQYIASGDERDLTVWEPRFTYHGFRYAQITGLSEPLKKEDIWAVSRYTDIGSRSSFRCGNPWINTIHHNAVQTEKSNLHSILTDCPQRDERMGWMNDATVRFEATPYNFEIGRIFPKVVRDLMDVQGQDGEITCTAPFAFGGRPADPVCSSFLIAAKEAWMQTGNTEILREGYEAFRAWDDYLESRSEGHIVQYSYYGDWAAPEYACKGSEWAASEVTPGELMSTGYHYLNNVLLAKFAEALGKEEDQKNFQSRANAIRDAFLCHWYDEETARVGTGSEGCQAFALWLGILPEDGRQKAAERLRNDLVERNYRFTTGNLCTRYMLEVLSQYGYLEEAWHLLVKEDYPSFGYMIQQEATTIWERFELKKNPTMNSHNHPMYGAVDYWFYAYLAGIRPVEAGWRKARIRPYMPKNLSSAQATVETPMGDITVRWVKRYGNAHLYVTIPFGMKASVVFAGKEEEIGSGFHHYCEPLEEA